MVILKIRFKQKIAGDDIYLIRAVATAPEKTPTEKVKFSEL